MTLLLFVLSIGAHAQWQTTHWLHLDGVYAQTEAKQDAALATLARRAAARGELGLNLFGHLALSGGARYEDGGFAASGKTLTGAVPQSFGSGREFETRALVHLVYAPIVISGGLAQAEVNASLPSAYSTVTKYDYKPVAVTLNFGAIYLRYEQDLWGKGSVGVSLSDLGGGRNDVRYALTKASGQGAEVGILIPGKVVGTHVFVGYHRWAFDGAPAANDGVESVKLPPTVVTRLEAGVGLAF